MLAERTWSVDGVPAPLSTVRLGPTDAQGRCEVTVDLGLRFLDAHGRIPSKSAPLPPAVAKVVAPALAQPGRFSPPSRLTYALKLKSREPLCFPPAQLAGGSTAWPLFTGHVGKGGGNALERALPTNTNDMHGVPGTNIFAGHVARGA